jgi:outer membrane cobalamin receptor
VRGRVTTPEGRPLASANVRVIGVGRAVLTSTDGTFAITDAGIGTQTIEARAIGYSPYRTPVRLHDAVPLDVTLVLAVQRVQLDTVRVVAGRELTPELRGIERRWRAGVGTIMNAITIRDRAATFVTDALRSVPGVRVSQVGGFGQDVLMNSPFTGGVCKANVFIDGMRVAASGSANVTIDDMVTLSDIAAFEVYPRANLAPPEYTTMAGGCGVVAVWTKRATGGVTPVKPPKAK